ncbi:serine O-acetyltransferase [Robbsia sp. Bb-Pol-6]|uniref:Serine acetyltransferase n=1 Tax=Robbsia betulipollinis TaxID=2981849 RepID=A0ABT3ZJF9_9BURK|nr:serine O-acetyltransferase [Robbsia betulipollinis]
MTATEKLAVLLRQEAAALQRREPIFATLLQHRILTPPTFSAMLCRLLAARLADAQVGEQALFDIFAAVHRDAPLLVEQARHDIEAVLRRDPASDALLHILLDQKGFQAIQTHRLAHALWNAGRRELARWLQGASSRTLGVDMHPAARIGRGIMFDHATGIVIGETCVIGDDVSIMQAVTLGGTGNQTGNRHPKIGDGVLIGAGATLLGNLIVGHGAKVGAGSVVLNDVPPGMTVVGIPARIVGQAGGAMAAAADEMNQNFLKEPTAGCFGDAQGTAVGTAAPRGHDLRSCPIG